MQKDRNKTERLIKAHEKLFLFFETESCSVARLECSTRSQLTATSDSLVQATILPQCPEYLGLEARATMPS